MEAENVLFIGRQWDMNPVFSIVDLAVCRGGASTLAELEAYNISSLVIPWGKSSDNHQDANAHKFSEITDNFIWRENQAAEELISLISLGASKQKERVTGLHDNASINLFRSFEEKYGDGGKMSEQ
jgi:UDP-N-acetylglucosamine--N-acetylmuramyl-(pentapeptide) pyrophosphoryl-undecaprenol N-acetylglucosamine transferase